MDPRYLVQLAVIVDTGSLSRAAEQLNVAQPTLTRTVKIIEDRTGTPVLKRERYGVVATPLGKELAEIGKKIAAQTEIGRDLANVWLAGLNGQLKVGIGTLFAQLTTQRLAKRTLESSWKYKLAIEVGLVRTMIEDLGNHALDVVVTPDPAAFPETPLSQVPLFEAEICAVIGTGSPLYKKDKIDHEELARQPWINSGTSSGVMNSIIAMESAGLPIVDKLSIGASNHEVTELLRTSNVVTLQAMEVFQGYQADTDHPGRIYRFPNPTFRMVSAWLRMGDEDRVEIVHFLDQLRELVRETLPEYCWAFDKPVKVARRS